MIYKKQYQWPFPTKNGQPVKPVKVPVPCEDALL